MKTLQRAVVRYSYILKKIIALLIVLSVYKQFETVSKLKIETFVYHNQSKNEDFSMLFTFSIKAVKMKVKNTNC